MRGDDPVKHRRLGLIRGGVLLGRMTLIDREPPVLRYLFKATPAFEAVAPLFAAELATLGAEDLTEWRRAYDRIREPGLALEMPDGALYDGDFVIHVQGEEATLRL